MRSSGARGGPVGEGKKEPLFPRKREVGAKGTDVKKVCKVFGDEVTDGL